MRRLVNNITRLIYLSILICLVFGLQYGLIAQSIVNTVHNLSASGTGELTAAGEDEICVFCHTPHTAKEKSPLWNRKDPALSYNLYSNALSSTLDANPGQPDGATILCLSCHDGTIALGKVLSRPQEISFSKGVNVMPEGKSMIGKDLSNDHPVSFLYTPSLSAIDPELKDPSTLTGPVRLQNEKLQCTSCHDPHKNVNGSFLVETTEKSTLCMNCHQVRNWQSSSHSTSSASWSGTAANPWSHRTTAYKTVEQNACENCHRSHNAGGKAQLMNFTAEESNCLNCHNGSVASGAKNIQTQLTKAYKHDVMGYTKAHDPSEPALSNIKHVECSDCHNPHETNGTEASAPDVNGFLAGVKGITSNGSPVDVARYEYEICYRCHSDIPASPPATQRQIMQANTRLEFAMNAVSYHPVVGPGKNTNVPGLISPMSEASILYCSDCHASDGSDSPSGPHGSIYPYILKAQYSKTENIIESASAYALCYSCHSRAEYNQNAGDNVRTQIHYKHVVEVKTSCNTCHDPHGISSLQGLPNRNTHLINFNTNVVSSVNGGLYFQDNGERTGTCLLKCHNKTHNQISY